MTSETDATKRLPGDTDTDWEAKLAARKAEAERRMAEADAKAYAQLMGRKRLERIVDLTAPKKATS